MEWRIGIVFWSGLKIRWQLMGFIVVTMAKGSSLLRYHNCLLERNSYTRHRIVSVITAVFWLSNLCNYCIFRLRFAIYIFRKQLSTPILQKSLVYLHLIILNCRPVLFVLVSLFANIHLFVYIMCVIASPWAFAWFLCSLGAYDISFELLFLNLWAMALSHINDRVIFWWNC